MNKPRFCRRLCAVLLLIISVPACAEQGPVDLLQQYLRIDTTNPPGNEARAADFLAKILAAEGIDFETAESAPGRVNLWARLEGGDGPGLLLLHHTDVVSADAAAWDVPPLSGEIRDGYLYGRGALDMKSQGIMHLVTFIALHRAGRPLNRDVVFMATADEEAGSAFGMGWLVENRPEVFDGIGLTVTEGGGGVEVNGQLSFGVEVAQKYPVWLRLTANGTPGHGSTPRVDSAVDRLLAALAAIRAHPFEARIVPEVDAYFKQLAKRFPGKMGAAMADIEAALADEQIDRTLQTTIPQLYALTRNTCAITRLAGSGKVNVLPAQASAEIDCRLLPDENADNFLARLEAIVDDPNVTIDPILILSPATSSTDTELYAAINTILRERYPDTDVGPSVSTGFTDSHHLRKRGIVSYGFTPAAIPLADYAGIHGNNERISVDNVLSGSQLLQEIVELVAY